MVEFAPGISIARQGLVSLVGAGPGNPGLLTAQALDRLSRADVVLYDALLPPALLALIPPRARILSVGKQAGRPSRPQDEIHALFLREARAGNRVVRLKGGDPFIFGRGGEETEFLKAAGVPFEVIPGVTAALGAAAAHGIPLTQRGVARSVRFVTGTPAATGSGCDAGARTAEARAQETQVFYMAGLQLEHLARELMESGQASDTPVAVIERATWDDSACHAMALGDLEEFASRHAVRTPALLIVGPTASRAESAPAPESGAVAVAGALQDLERVAEPLRKAGIHVHQIPLLRIISADPRPLREKLLRLDRYGAIRFQDAHTVEPFRQALLEAGKDLRALAGVRLTAGDPWTAAALARMGLSADAVVDGSGGPRPAETLRCLVLGAPSGAAPETPRAETPEAAEDHVAAYAFEPFPLDVESCREELRRSPPRLWLLTSEAARTLFLSFLASIANARGRQEPAGSPAHHTERTPARKVAP